MSRNYNGPGYVYIMSDVDSGMFKVGHSRSPEQRLKQLRYGCPTITPDEVDRQRLRIAYVKKVNASRDAEAQLAKTVTRNLGATPVAGEWYWLDPGWFGHYSLFNLVAARLVKKKQEGYLRMRTILTGINVEAFDWGDVAPTVASFVRDALEGKHP